MDYLVLGVAAFGASLLTFFSGFGLGTIMAPLFALFFPIDVAIAMTGVVHFTNNIIKIVLIGRNVDRCTRSGLDLDPGNEPGCPGI